MRKINAKKFDMSMLYEFILLVAVIVIVAIMVFTITEDQRDEIVTGQATTATCNATSGVYTGCGTAYNATVDADSAVAKIPKSLKLLGTAVIFGAVLFVILRVIPMKGTSSTFQ